TEGDRPLEAQSQFSPPPAALIFHLAASGVVRGMYGEEAQDACLRRSSLPGRAKVIIARLEGTIVSTIAQENTELSGLAFLDHLLFEVQAFSAVDCSQKCVSTVSYWLGRSCGVGDDCPASLSMCFEGKCLCYNGYYFSHSRGYCVPCKSD
ncbi:hypothetical protein BaRGS_00023665, partial [Batillaria attramentaria]